MHQKIPVKALVIATATLLGLGLGGCAGKQDQAVRNLTDDEIMTLRQKQAAAKEMPTPDPNLATAPAKEIKGDQLLRQGQASAALFEYHRALTKAKPKQATRLRLKIGQIHLRMKQYLQAESQFAEILQNDQDCAPAWQGQGLNQLSQGKLKQASNSFVRAITLDPKLWKSLNALGVIHNRTGHPDLALDVFDRALAIEPGSAALYNNKGLSLMLLKNYHQAELQFKKALSLNPDHKLALNNLGLLAAKQGHWKEAQRYFELGLGKAKAHHNLGVLMADQGMSAQAAEQFRRAMETSPSHYDRASKGLKQLEATTPAPELLTPKNRHRHFEIDIQKNTPLKDASSFRKPEIKKAKEHKPQHKLKQTKLSPEKNSFSKKINTTLSKPKPAKKNNQPRLTMQLDLTQKTKPRVKAFLNADLRAGAWAGASIALIPRATKKKPQETKLKSRTFVRKPMPKLNIKDAVHNESFSKKRRGFIRKPMPKAPVILTQKAPKVLPVDIPYVKDKPENETKGRKVFFIQVASLRSKNRAQLLGKEISRFTEKVKLEKWQSGKQIKWQRVLLGPFKAKKEALNQLVELENAGLVSEHLVFSRWQGQLI